MRGNFFYYRLGSSIVRTREKRRISQEQLAFRCGVDRTYISRIEQGRANPTIKVIEKIATALKTRLHYLLRNCFFLIIIRNALENIY
ncbi:hypothetical protein B6D29_02565 [Microgenomates bacterium UTCPR1]|nr:helix-turn-helix transcriptional regulator [Patescibacteria group bacterium]OQY66764.1 MAG: hypothetical protein B6D29_02565 [Microgenomates bacterium UTCPR1]